MAPKFFPFCSAFTCFHANLIYTCLLENEFLRKRIAEQHNKPSRLSSIMNSNLGSEPDPAKSRRFKSTSSINRNKFESRIVEENKRISEKLQVCGYFLNDQK